jgi:hypothetical protein
MLTPSDIDVLNALSHDLAQRIGGDGNVERSSDGVVRLTILNAQESGGLYPVREVIASRFQDACDQITRVVESLLLLKTATETIRKSLGMPHHGGRQCRTSYLLLSKSRCETFMLLAALT